MNFWVVARLGVLPRHICQDLLLSLARLIQVITHAGVFVRPWGFPAWRKNIDDVRYSVVLVGCCAPSAVPDRSCLHWVFLPHWAIVTTHSYAAVPLFRFSSWLYGCFIQCASIGGPPGLPVDWPSPLNEPRVHYSVCRSSSFALLSLRSN